MSTLSLTTLVVIAIVLVFFVLPLRMSWRSKGLIALITIVAPCKSYLHLLVGGDAFDPNIPYNLSFVFDIARTTIIFLALLTLLRLILNLGYRIIHFKWHSELLPTSSLFHAQLMLLVSFALACYGTSCAYGTPELKRYELTLERLDPRLEGMKVVMLSDIHISAPTDVNVIYQLVNDVNALKPDLILLPGDLMDGALSKRRPISDLLFDLKAKFGVFITAGNHEYYSGYEEWRHYFEQGGLISLDNKVVALKDNQGKTLLNLGGITDPRAEHYNLPTPDVSGVTQALDDSAPSIILSHRPQYAVDFALAASQINAQRAAQSKEQKQELVQKQDWVQKRVDLVLSGHTHGGLVYGLRELVANANGGFVSGHYRIDKTDLIVGNGTMVWMGFPLRLGVPSQIVELTLHSKRPKGQLPLPLAQRLTAAAEIRRQAALKQQAQKEQEQLQQRIATHGVAASQPQLPAPAARYPAQGSAELGATSSNSERDRTIASYSLAPSDDVKPSGSVTHIPRELSNLELILPMVDAETGAVSSAVTKLALLPERITQDQLRRINEILAEKSLSPEELAEQAQAEEILEQGLSSDPKSGVTVVLLKDAPITKPHSKPQGQTQGQPQDRPQGQPATSSEAPNKDAAPSESSAPSQPSSGSAGPSPAATQEASLQGAPANGAPAPLQRGQLHLTATPAQSAPSAAASVATSADSTASSADSVEVETPLSDEEHADQMTDDEDNALLNLGPVSEASAYTLELQTEYAISLDPNNQNRPDSTVSDLLTTPEGAPAQPEAAPAQP